MSDPAGDRETRPPLNPDEERLWAVGAHIGPVVLGFVAPLVVWVVFRERSEFLDRHGREALNFQISYVIYVVVAAILIKVLIGLFLLAVVVVAWFVLMVVAAVHAANRDEYRYPLIFRFVT